MKCIEPDCSQEARARKMCDKHYRRLRRSGKMNPITLEDRFWAKVKKARRCWEWTGALDEDGYGLIWFHNRSQLAHRVSFFIAHGCWPTEVDHTCTNKKCVRPSHLEEVSHAENMRRWMNKRKVAA